MNIEQRTAILYEAFDLLKSLTDCFDPPYTPNEARVWHLIDTWEKMTNEEQLGIRFSGGAKTDQKCLTCGTLFKHGKSDE